MNSLHALCYSQFEIKHNVYAPPGAFSPPPKVDSQVLNFHRRNNPLIDLNLLNQFEHFLRLSFSQKRKQLFGLLKNQYGSEKATLIMNSAQINLNIRAESLTFDQIVRLFNHSLI